MGGKQLLVYSLDVFHSSRIPCESKCVLWDGGFSPLARTLKRGKHGSYFFGTSATTCAPGSAVTTLVFSTQDEAVSGYAEDRIKEAEKYIVPCEDMPEPPEKSRGDGSITFHTRLDHYLDFDEYDRFVKSAFDLYRGPMGTVEFRGTGKFKQRSKSPRFAFTSKCTGTAEIRGNGGTTAISIDVK